MWAVYPTKYFKDNISDSNELFKLCEAGDYEKVKTLVLEQNVNIYKRAGGDFSFVSLFVALQSKNQEIVNLLLDVYESDLEALSETSFKRALVAMPEDQSEELLKALTTESDGFALPVLLKSKNLEKPRCAFMRTQLRNKDDLSIKLAKYLETENGFCDLNWRTFKDELDESFLHLAVYYEMTAVVKRLMSNFTVDCRILNSRNHSPLHYAVFIGNLEIVKLLMSKADSDVFISDSSYLYQAAMSGQQKVVDFVIEQMIASGKILQGILEIPFTIEEYQSKHTANFLLHVLARNGNFLQFINSRNFNSIDEETFCCQNSNGDTVLHFLVLSYQRKLDEKINLISKFAGKYPKLLMVENNDRHLPLHLAAFHDTRGQRLYNHILKLTAKSCGNPEIFLANVDAAVSAVEKAIELNKGISSDYIKHFEKIFQSHRTRFLHKTIQIDKSFKSLNGILSSSLLKINPNEFYNGTNGFLLVLNDNSYDRNFNWHPSQETFKRFRMLMEHYAVEDFNASDESGRTLFMLIVGFCNDNEFMRSLIAAGADCRVETSDGLTCLHHAAVNHKNKEIIQLLIDNGADPTKSSSKLGLAIHVALRSENVNAVKTLSRFLTVEDLTRKVGPLKETLIQSAMHSTEEVFPFLVEVYRNLNIKIDVNERNDDGDNLPMIACGASRAEHLDFIFTNFIDEIDFEALNKQAQTFTYKFSSCQQMMRSEFLFDKFPILSTIVNQQINLVNDDGVSAMDNLVVMFTWDSSDEYFEFITKRITFEKLQESFYKFFECYSITQKLMQKFPNMLDDMTSSKLYNTLEHSTHSNRIFTILLEKLSNCLSDVKSTESKNVLHLVCEHNDLEIIDVMIKSLSGGELRQLADEVDDDNKKPFQVLSEANKIVFENVFLIK